MLYSGDLKLPRLQCATVRLSQGCGRTALMATENDDFYTLSAHRVTAPGAMVTSSSRSDIITAGKFERNEYRSLG
jgi:hypothetical protein